MPLEFGGNSPWLDNWPVQRQLWQFTNSREPGEELNLSDSINRLLTAQWRDAAGNVVYAKNEADTDSPIRVLNATRGVVEVVPRGDIWDFLSNRETYTLEIIAYGVLYSAEEYTVSLPSPGYQLLNGVEVYGAPREILELLGTIPGASVSVSVPLLDGWALNAQGYWQKSIPAEHVSYGLWVDDLHAIEVAYSELALGPARCWARHKTTATTHTLYYKGPEDLTSEFVETAYSRYILRCLQEATRECDRKTGSFFSQQRVIREVHRGLGRMRQLMTRHRPIQIDAGFRLDAYSYTRDLYRRYTEADFLPEKTFANSGEILHADVETGAITINQNVYDWWDVGNYQAANYGLASYAYLPRGENNIEISYVAGAAKVPTDIAEAVANMAACRQAIFWQQALTQGMSGLSIGCVNFNFGEFFKQWMPGWQQSADQILNGYQSLEIEVL